MERLKNGEFALRENAEICRVAPFINISEATALTGGTDALYQGEKNYPNLGK